MQRIGVLKWEFRDGVGSGEAEGVCEGVVEGGSLEGERRWVTKGTNPRKVASGKVARPHEEQDELSWRWRARRRAGTVEHTGDGVGCR